MRRAMRSAAMNLYAGSSTGESVSFAAGFGNDEPVVLEGMNRASASLPERPIETGKAGGSNPPPRAIKKLKPFQFRWREPLGKAECPYAYRTILNLGLFSVRVHHWMPS